MKEFISGTSLGQSGASLISLLNSGYKFECKMPRDINIHSDDCFRESIDIRMGTRVGEGKGNERKTNAEQMLDGEFPL